MLGFRFLKAQPTQYVMQFRNGRARRQGAGLSGWYFAPSTSLVIVRTASVTAPFMFEEVTADFQDITIQGQITYRVADPQRAAAMLDFTLDAQGRFLSDDPKTIGPRLIDQVRVAVRGQFRGMPLQHALGSGATLVETLRSFLRKAEPVAALGLEVLDLAILAIKPKPETARALEAETREALLQRADEAIYARRNAAVEQERAIKENELNTEIAVETKKRQIKETQMEADRVLRERRRRIEQEEMEGKVGLEEQKRALVELETANARQQAETKAYGIDTMMKAFAASDAKVLQALASVGMQPAQLLAVAFRDLADNAGKIGQLNISPDLLQEMIGTGRGRQS